MRPRIWSVLVSIVLLAGCAASGSARPSGSPGARRSVTQPAPTRPLRDVTLRLSFLVAGYADPYILAQQRGYYRQVGLNVKIVEGKGSAITGQTVGNGDDPFGLVGATDAALLITKGVPLMTLGVFIQDSPMAFIHDPQTRIASPRDLIGKRIIATAGGAVVQMLPVVLARYGMRLSDLKRMEMVQPAAQAQVFKDNPGSVLLGFTTSNYPAVLKLVPDAVATPYSAFGFDLYDSGLVTNLNELRRHPGVVRGFVAASVKGWQAATADPRAAVAATLKAFPGSDAAIQRIGLKNSLALLHTAASQGHPDGWMAAADWRNTLQALERYGGLKDPKPLSHYYTDAYIPGGA